MGVAYRDSVFDCDIIIELSCDAECYRLEVNCVALGCIVENDLVRVVVVASVRCFDVSLVAIVVVTLAHCATVDVSVTSSVARKSNEGCTAYPRKIYSQQRCYFCQIFHFLTLHLL